MPVAMEDILEIAGKSIKNRLFIGTGKFASYSIMKNVLEAVSKDAANDAKKKLEESGAVVTIK